jgi:hypothetical protein
MVEGRLVERPQLAIDTGVLRMANDAVVLHVLVHTNPPADPFCDRLMTGETSPGRDPVSAFMTRLAVAQSLDGRVDFGEAAGRHQGPELRLDSTGRREQDQQRPSHPREVRETHHHRNGT